MALLIALACVCVLLISVAAGYGLRFRSEMKRLSPVPTGSIVDSIHAIKDGHVNMYLIHHNGTYVAIDAGTSTKGVADGLKKIGVKKSEIGAVFLTHSDRDHVGGLNLFEAATVYLPKEEEPLATGKTRRMFIFGNRIDTPYQLVSDGQMVDVGGVMIRCISTPGHTPGSVCYVANDRYLFTGDTLSLKNGYAGVFSDFFNMDSPAQTASFRKISNLSGIEYVFTAHHGFTENYGRIFQQWNG
jgi:hydroxyacylglutathione hydrolase